MMYLSINQMKIFIYATFFLSFFLISSYQAEAAAAEAAMAAASEVERNVLRLVCSTTHGFLIMSFSSFFNFYSTTRWMGRQEEMAKVERFLFYFSKILNVIIFLKNQTFIIKFFLFRLSHELFFLESFSSARKTKKVEFLFHHSGWLPEVRVLKNKICNLKCNLFF